MEYCKPHAIRGSVYALEIYQWRHKAISKVGACLELPGWAGQIHYITNECFMEG